MEASPWVEDNLWVLMIIENEPMIVGMVGNLDPAKPEFREYLERYHRNKLFLGIRYGNIWEGHNLVTAIDNSAFIATMKVFAQTGLTLEVANPRLDLIDATVRLTDKVPELRRRDARRRKSTSGETLCRRSSGSGAIPNSRSGLDCAATA